MIVSLGFLFICFTVSHGSVTTAGIFYEEISTTIGSTINEESMARISLLHESLHPCSMNETCNYVIKNKADGSFTLCTNEDELPQNREGFRIWRKIIPGRCIYSFQYL